MTAPTLSDHEALVRYLERQFHRVSNERYALRFWSWFWFGAARHVRLLGRVPDVQQRVTSPDGVYNVYSGTMPV